MTERPAGSTAQSAPFFVASLLFPATMLAALFATRELIQAGMEIPHAIGVVTFSVFFLAALCERLWPYRTEWNRNTHRDLQVDIKHFIHNALWMRLCETLALAACAFLAIRLAQAYGSTLWPTHWHWSLQLLLAVVLGEFIEYWVHRAQHEIPWLWRFHAVHHSAPRLYWFNAIRFHPIDLVASGVGRLLPAALLGAEPMLIALYTIFSGVHGVFQHCNIPMRIGPLNWVFSMAELHRWHHSKTVVESNANYGGNVIFWDILFGTRFFPKDREPPQDIGMTGFPRYPMEFLGQVTSPFHWQKILRENHEPL